MTRLVATIVTTQERVRKELSSNEHDYRGMQHTGEHRLYASCILFDERRRWTF
jgi:hypothetical protein